MVNDLDLLTTFGKASNDLPQGHDALHEPHCLRHAK
jgi:hypothetical protein